MSNLELWFYNNIILKNELQNKYDIVNEYPIYPYFIDFAFLNINLAVELDGQCHFIDGKRIKHDQIKNDSLIQRGWNIYRISGNDLKNNAEKDFLEYLENFNINTKKLETKVYKGTLKKLEKKRTRIEYYEDKKRKTDEKNKIFIDNVLNSNINFSAFGWVQKVAVLINQKPQKVNNWMKRYLNDFFQTNCFKRKSILKKS